MDKSFSKGLRLTPIAILIAMLTIQAIPLASTASTDSVYLLVEDPKGDVTSWGNMILGLSTADVTSLEISMDSNSLSFKFTIDSELPEPGQYGDTNNYIAYIASLTIEASREGEGLYVMLEAIITPVIGFGAQNVAYLTIEGSSGSATFTSNSTIEGNTFIVQFPEPNIGSLADVVREFLGAPDALDAYGDFSIGVVDPAFNPVQTLTDEISYTFTQGQTGTETETATSTSATETATDVATTTRTGTTSPDNTTTLLPADENAPFFSQLTSSSSLVEVSFSGKPTVEISVTSEDGMMFITYSASAQGTSRNAHHVGIGYEIYYKGEFVGQGGFNMTIGPSPMYGESLEKGLYENLRFDLQGGMGYVEMELVMQPATPGDWSSWTFKISFTRALPMGSGLPPDASNIEKMLFKNMDRLYADDITVLVFALGFENIDESVFTISKIDASIQVTVDLEEDGVDDTGTQTQVATESPRKTMTGTGIDMPVTGTKGPGDGSEERGAGETSPNEGDSNVDGQEGEEGINTTMVIAVGAVVLTVMGAAAYLLFSRR